MSIINDLELVKKFLDRSDAYSLTAECLLSAINLTKQYPSAPVESILLHALETWDCGLGFTEADYWDGDETDKIPC